MLPVWLTDTFTADLDRALHYTLLWGMEGIVLRTVGGVGDRVPHVNEARLKRRLAEHDLPVLAVDPGLFEMGVSSRGTWLNDLALLGEVAAFCNRIGCPRILVGALPGEVNAAAEVLQKAGAIAAKRGCVLAVQNETDGRSGAHALADLLAATDHPAVRACWSPAVSQSSGEPVKGGADALAGRIDMVMADDGPASAGRWLDALRGLREGGFDGPVCLRLHDPGAASDGLRAATALIQAMRKTRREAQ